MTDLTSTIRVGRYGDIERGIHVPHEAANLNCAQPIGERKDHDTGIPYTLVCKKRAGHEQPVGEAPHVPSDTRILASTPKRAKGFRFAPSGIPAAVDQSITLPHDCANHLKDVEEVERGYR